MADEVGRVRAMVAATPPEGFCGCAAAIREMDLRERLRDVAVPTLVVVGEDDPGTPVSAARAIHERIAGSRLLVIPEAAHFVHMEQAQAFNAAVTEFLAGAA
jgi:3-oxoadipate enol-lactonase